MLVIATIVMVLVIAMAGFAVDVGHAYLVQRQLQAGVDAAALSAAQDIPNSGAVTATAHAYGPSATGKNATTTVRNAVTEVELKCIQSAPGCSSRFGSFNAVKVSASSAVPTYLARIIGIDDITVRASATACSPCSARPLDIMVALDRTGSMCQVGNGQDDHPACSDVNNAKDGIRTFLEFMDSEIDKVGLAVFPPALNSSSRCTTPTNGQSRYGYDTYWPAWNPSPGLTPGLYAIAPLQFGYLVPTNGGIALNPASQLIQMINCTQTNGTTSYANAILEAQHELETNGRPEVQDVLIFLSDGAANTTPRFTASFLDNTFDRARPCGSGIKAAAAAKAAGTLVYSIGYDLNGLGTDYERCRNPTTGGDEGITAYDTIRQIASEPANFYNKPDPGQLNTIFTRIAADISRPAARLIDESLT